MGNNIILNDQLIVLGNVADQIASAGVFDDYRARKAANTLRRQDADLELFASYIVAKGVAIDDLTTAQSWRGISFGLVEGFKRWMLAEGYAIGSVNVRLSTVKAYAKLAFKAGALNNGEYAAIRAVEGYPHKESHHINERRAEAGVKLRRDKSRKAENVQLSTDQRRALKSHPYTPQGRRDKLLMCLFLDHGLRCGEMALLEVTDFDLKHKTFTFYRPKVHKVQTHKLSRDTVQAARDYFGDDAPLSGRLLRSSRKNGALTHAGMSERAITKRVNELGKLIGIEKLSAHDLRHSWATTAAQHKTDAFALQEAGGWNSLAMPRRYVDAAKVANEHVNLGGD